MMFGDKQGQQVGAGALAVQAGRDVTINNGPSVTEIRELVQLFLENNFPVLRQEAKAAAEVHVREFLGVFENKIVSLADKIDVRKFAEPDVQATINDAVQATARRGLKANPEILCSLIIERISAKPDDFADVVLSEAVQVVPKLSEQQIALLVLTHYLTGVVVETKELDKIDEFSRILSPLCIGADGISLAQNGHVQYIGVGQLIGFFSEDIYESQFRKYGVDVFPDVVAFKEAVKIKTPYYSALLEMFARNNFGSISLTSVGQAIAIARMSEVISGIDYSEWIN